MAAGQNNVDVDAGLAPLASLGDTVFEDLDRDGIQDAGEPGVPGVTVILLDAAGDTIDGIDPVVTDVDGNYGFDDLPSDTYIVQVTLPDGRGFTAQDVGGDEDVDSDVDPATGITDLVFVEAGEETRNVDAGVRDLVVELASLGNFVFLDIGGEIDDDTGLPIGAGNGLQDSGEIGALGVQVVLTGGGALLRDIDRLLMEETGLPVLIAEDPLTCVTRGGGRILELMDQHGGEFFSVE